MLDMASVKIEHAGAAQAELMEGKSLQRTRPKKRYKSSIGNDRKSEGVPELLRGFGFSIMRNRLVYT